MVRAGRGWLTIIIWIAQLIRVVLCWEQRKVYNAIVPGTISFQRFFPHGDGYFVCIFGNIIRTPCSEGMTCHFRFILKFQGDLFAFRGVSCVRGFAIDGEII